MGDSQLAITIVVVSLIIFILVVIFLLLIVLNSNRKSKHASEVSNMKLNFEREVMEAEKEAIQTTLLKVGEELHDNVGQLLTASKLAIMNEFDSDEYKDKEVEDVLNYLDQSISEVNRLGRTLNEDLWDNRNFTLEVSEECARLNRIGKINFRLNIKESKSELDKSEKIILYRVFQEVVNNCLKNSRASEVEILLTENPFVMRIEDNGIGFSKDEISEGAGIYNIHRRCKMINVDSTLETNKNEGCKWKFEKI